MSQRSIKKPRQCEHCRRLLETTAMEIKEHAVKCRKEKEKQDESEK